MSFLRILLVLLLGAVSAVAASITFVQTTPGYPAPGQNVVDRRWNQGLGFPQFDPALGELISVTVGVEYFLTASASFPTYGLGGVYTLRAFQFVEIVPPTLFAPQWPLPWISWASQERTMTVASTEALVVFPELTTSNSLTLTRAITPDPTANWAQFIGTGQVAFTVYGGGAPYMDPPISHVSGPHLTRGPIAASTAAEVSLTYNYNPIPEPAYSALLGMLGVVAVAIARRRSSSSR